MGGVAELSPPSLTFLHLRSPASTVFKEINLSNRLKGELLQRRSDWTTFVRLLSLWFQSQMKFAQPEYAKAMIPPLLTVETSFPSSSAPHTPKRDSALLSSLEKHPNLNKVSNDVYLCQCWNFIFIFLAFQSFYYKD